MVATEKAVPGKSSPPKKVAKGKDRCVAETEEREKAGVLGDMLCGERGAPVKVGGRESAQEPGSSAPQVTGQVRLWKRDRIFSLRLPAGLSCGRVGLHCSSRVLWMRRLSWCSLVVKNIVSDCLV